MKHFNLESQTWEGEDDTETLNSLAFLQSIYRDDGQPLSVRAAIESLPFEVPKLVATASAQLDSNSFAALLDRAIERSRAPKMIEAQPVEQHSAEELKGPMERLRRS